VAKKPDLSSLKKKPVEPTPVETPPAPAPVEEKAWRKRAQPSTVWFDERQMLLLKKHAYLKKTSVRDLLFEAINLLLQDPKYNEIAIDRNDPRDVDL
jgi:hypothetical protein